MKIKEASFENLRVHVYDDRVSMGHAAADEAAFRINRIIGAKGEANIIFAAAPSQNDLIARLLEHKIDWTKVRALQQDEYIGIDAAEPAGFGNFLKRSIYEKLPLKEIHYLLAPGDQIQAKIDEYSRLLTEYPADLIFLGVGENGHLAFNDPPVADFEDPHMIKAVDLDLVCRQQQVNDGCFAQLEDVPKQALTLTLSFIRSVPEAICVVPTERKAKAIDQALRGPISTDCPASILRKLPDASLYLDRDSASLAFQEI